MKAWSHLIQRLSVVGALLGSVCGGAQTYNFLWVVGNSGTMVSKRAIVQAHFPVFIDALRKNGITTFKMAMTTTDLFTDQGKLVTGPNGLKVVSSSSPDPAVDFNQLMGTLKASATSFWPQGLEASEQALLLHASEFIDPGPLVVIYLTDHNDYSCEDKCYGVEPQNNTDYVPVKTRRYGDTFQLIKKFSGNKVMIYSIVGTPDSTCTFPSMGTRYVDVQTAVGAGAVESICDDQLAQSLDNIVYSLAAIGK